MIPEEKAKELYHKLLTCQPDMYLAKQCALICVDEIVEALPYNQIPKFIFWSEVKKEIEKS